jgi:hypothetical protein
MEGGSEDEEILDQDEDDIPINEQDAYRAEKPLKRRPLYR